MNSRDAAERTLALHDGVIRRADLVHAGVSRRWIRQAMESEYLSEVWPGVLSTQKTRSHVLLGAVRYAGGDAVISHSTAAELWGLGEWWRSRPEIHVSVRKGHHLRAPSGLLIHQAARLESLRLAHLPVTPVMRTLADCAPIMDMADLRAAATTAVRKRFVDTREFTESAAPRRASGVWRLLTEEIEAGAWSGPEAGYWRLLKDARLPLPILNARVDTPEGTRFVDALWPELRFGTEIDGRTVHAQEAAFETDRYRQNALVFTGLVLLRFPAADVYRRPCEVVRITTEALAARAAELGHLLVKRRGQYRLLIQGSGGSARGSSARKYS